ncbi:DUF4126 domain-containing protein [Glaciimonas sp. CA11.2]|uniref:DUF4126 domain-containing protein n=1 Tax=unclassified Glaciimonas TaxID=2644401 RepID=UPI002AB5BF06|nr:MULTISPECIES: DUF4126 domain-containing protein [unclassified Glaciimonas]MDY7544977.1 DUF4126 domain-containing protein [Glaciimonas sp. CA11.2]MEB0013280.1 DUF4126 domain-containing protein [Glaciimonas sp. Cout2]MEB0082479.1 DUF4126 domain-containing protein [Glaciimonas sp. Gout2]MEB0164087.1 DUF4126 domain-containing protein [Glaciimonas sp. CA11.2]
MVDTLSTAAMAAGLSWASGIRLYMALFVAGLFGRLGWITLPHTLEVLQSPWILGITGLLMLVEFLADKIPGLDSIWDAVQTFIRIPAGAVLSAAAMGHMDPAVTTAAALVGGTFAASAHATKAGSRAMINTSPEPLSNWAASFSEDVTVLGALWAAFYHPWVLFGFLLVFFIFAIWLLPKLWRSLRWVFQRLST